MPFFAHTKIKPLRQAKGLNQAEIAAELGVSRPTYVLIEQGEKEPTISQLFTLARLLGVGVNDLGTNLPSLTRENSDYPKFKQLISACIVLAGNEGAITKAKLSILTYLIDFTYYRQHSRPISGEIYRHTPRGPVADDYFRAIDELYEGQSIALEPSGSTLVIRSIEQVPTKLLSESELSLVQKICAKWQLESTEAIMAFVREQISGKANRSGEPIPYESVLSQQPDSLY